jgi:exonuclease SbcD
LQGKFAHISDCHIGAWRDPKLRELNDSAFQRAIDLCIQNQVDFVLISGDIFDVGIPEMSSVRSAVRKLKGLVDSDIPAYVVYGSHDYSPTTVSVVEVLTEAGLFANVGGLGQTEAESGEGEKNLTLKPVIDEKTRTQIAGLPARRGGLEKAFYERIKGSVAKEINENTYSIFVFHASINELQALNIPIEQSVSIEDLPRGFSYYAGGHLHKRSQGKIGNSPIVYPGPLFGTSYSDLELTAKAEKRGFAIVDFEENKTQSVRFVDLPSPKILSKNFDADKKSADQVESDIKEFISKENLAVKDSIVLIKVKGILASGKPSDIDWYEIRRLVLERGASVASINRMSLATKESRRLEVIGKGTKEEIEANVLAEHISSYKAPSPELKFLSASSNGLTKASRLLNALKTEKREEETKPTFERRIAKEASEILEFPVE